MIHTGVERAFHGYLARGAPFGPDDGTVSPWAAIASLPFAPDIVIETVRHAIEQLDLMRAQLYGIGASFNPTCPETTQNPNGWVSPCSGVSIRVPSSSCGRISGRA